MNTPTESTPTEDRSTRPVNFIHFHGLQLLVVEHAGIDYIPARPRTELAGMQWKGAQRSLFDGDNAILYGTARLIPPIFAGHGTTGCPEAGVTYIRLDRSRMFLARISTNNMRAKGNTLAADQLLTLQTEWAGVLHRYKTLGVAVKSGRSNTLLDLHQFARTRNLLTHPGERRAFTLLLRRELLDMGLPADLFDEPQGELFGREATGEASLADH